jgi:hypothetical protein
MSRGLSRIEALRRLGTFGVVMGEALLGSCGDGDRALAASSASSQR